ncbi:NUDIX domain-containing protein [Bacillus sp. Cs-700]|uniref:NUDIX domain-containing protein n=1 Tax=Bacillus sp. Cs-700 TaxID=2589818 RepID=UPI001407E52D|nr:NUDIX domain-containing protein [Bacillus sp. Cs-700]
MIKVKALGLLFREQEMLVEAYYGKHSKGFGSYYRPLGGNIEVGEHSKETVVREFQEELGIEVDVNQYLTCLENRFQIGEECSHEMIQIYTVSFGEPKYYEKDTYSFLEHDAVAKWISIKDVVDGNIHCYPNDLGAVLKRMTKQDNES